MLARQAEASPGTAAQQAEVSPGTLATEAIREASGLGREMVEAEDAVAAVADAEAAMQA